MLVNYFLLTISSTTVAYKELSFSLRPSLTLTSLRKNLFKDISRFFKNFHPPMNQTIFVFAFCHLSIRHRSVHKVAGNLQLIPRNLVRIDAETAQHLTLTLS